ncbi:MAG: hypothetical protein ACI9O0_001397, partial [Paracoccaceae bacterium]
CPQKFHNGQHPLSNAGIFCFRADPSKEQAALSTKFSKVAPGATEKSSESLKWVKETLVKLSQGCCCKS